MATPRFAWGIDIGNRALKAVKLIRDGDQIRVDDYDCIEHETVLSNAGDNREALVNNAITQFVAKHPMKGGAASIGVSGQSSFARFIKLPPVEPKKIPEIVRFEAIQQIPFPLDDVEWSYQLFQPSDSPDVEVGIFAMRKELIGQHIKNFTDHDLNVQVVQMNPLAVYNAMYYDNRIEGTTMVIDLGAENTDLIICDAESVWLRSIPIGGNNFTEALVKAFKLNFAKAEDLKRNAATSKYARQIFQAMRPVFADLVAEVQRSIGFYASVHRDSRIRKIVTVGGTFKLPGLQKYLQQNLQLEVERLDTFAAGVPQDPKQGATFQDNVLSLVSAYGLALQAMGEGKITSSLLPQRIRRERLWQEKTKFFAAAAALFILGTGIGYTSIFLNKMSYDAAADSRSRISGVLSQAQELDQQWQEISSKGGADRQQILNIRGMTEYRDLWTQLLADIERVAPKPDAPEKLKQVPRKERRIVRIDSINHLYLPDLSAAAANLQAFESEQGMTQQQQQMGGPRSFNGGGFMGGGMPGMGGGMGMGMGDSMEGESYMGGPAPEGGEAEGGGGATRYGYVVRIAGTTPFGSPAALLEETFEQGLPALTDGEAANGKRYRIEKCQIVFLQPLRNDQTRLQAIKAAYDAAVAAKQSGTFTNIPSPGFGGGFGGFNTDMMEMEGGFGGGFGGFPGGFGAAPAPGQQEDQELAFKDRLFPDEDIRNDQQFVAVALVRLDPPPPGQEDPAAAEGGEATEGEEGAAPPEGGMDPGAMPPDAAP